MKYFLSLLLFCTSVFAGDFTVLGGVSKFQAPGTGTYWNHNQAHDNFMTPAAVGLRYETERSGSISYAVQYTHFGAVTIDALAVLTDAPFPGGFDPETGGCTGPCAPLRRWKMRSDPQSVAVTMSKHFGKWSLEAGLNLYEVKTSGVVTETPESAAYGIAYPKHDLGVSADGQYHYPDARFLYLMPMLGIAYRDGPWSVRVQTWLMPTAGETPAAFSEIGIFTFLVGYTF